MIAGDVTVNKPGQTLTLVNDVRVEGTFLVDDSSVPGVVSTLELADFDVIISTPTGVFDLQGAVAGTGGVVLEREGILQGPGTYGNITLADNQPNNDDNGPTGVDQIELGSDVTFSGTLTLASGGIDAAFGGFDISPVGTDALVRRSVANSNAAISGSFNGLGNPYDLAYIRSDGDPNNITATTGDELTDDVRNLTVEAPSEINLDQNSDVNGTLNIIGVMVPATPATPEAITATADSASHQVPGQFTAALIVDGTGSSVTGSTATNAASTLGDVTVNQDNDFTISDIKLVDGSIQTVTGSTLDIALIGDPGNGLQTVDDQITIGGAAFTLSSDITADGGVDFNTGELAFGENNLTVTGPGSNFDGAPGVTYTAGAGQLVMDSPSADLGSNGVAIPNLSLLDVDVLTSDVVVSGVLFSDTDLSTTDPNQRGTPLT